MYPKLSTIKIWNFEIKIIIQIIVKHNIKQIIIIYRIILNILEKIVLNVLIIE